MQELVRSNSSSMSSSAPEVCVTLRDQTDLYEVIERVKKEQRENAQVSMFEDV